MREYDLTPWYAGKRKPARVGVYQRMVGEDAAGGFDVQYSYWTGLVWAIGGSSPDDAMKYRQIASNHQNVAWRGLTPPGLCAYEKSLIEARWKLASVSINDPALAAHPTAQVNAASWDFSKKRQGDTK
jgi:hypothetical protein